jgi:predicted GNAT superfamily acetyltransferase
MSSARATAPITIREVHDVESCRHFQELTRRVWGEEDVDLVPVHVSMTAIKNGGCLLGAFAEDGPPETGGMVGAAFGFLGVGTDRANGTPAIKFCSHIVGVLPQWQRQRVGLQLKLAQREAVLRQGITDWMTWTYDPLLRRNGSLNIHRLGATCCTYLHNLYGELNDDLNRGLETDRFQVDWRLNSPHVLHDIQSERPRQNWDAANLHVFPVRRREDGLDEPLDTELPTDGRPLAVPIPDDLSAVIRRDPGLSQVWRAYHRAVIVPAFAAGYTVVDCIELPALPHGRGHDYPGWRYILVREY